MQNTSCTVASDVASNYLHTTHYKVLASINLVAGGTTRTHCTIGRLGGCPRISINRSLGLISKLPTDSPGSVPTLISRGNVFVSSAHHGLRGLCRVPCSRVCHRVGRRIRGFVRVINHGPYCFTKRSLSAPRIRRTVISVTRRCNMLLGYFNLGSLPINAH